MWLNKLRIVILQERIKMDEPIKCKFHKDIQVNNITMNKCMFLKEIVNCDGVTNLYECPLWGEL